MSGKDFYKIIGKSTFAGTMEKVRIDKWLWSVRIFKSRTLATDACKGGKVKIDGESVKPSYLVAVGELVTVRKDGFNFQYEVRGLIEKRVGAPIAVTCYSDVTPAEERNKYEMWLSNKKRPMVVNEAPGVLQKKSAERLTNWNFDQASFCKSLIKILFRLK